MTEITACNICFHECHIEEGKLGFCKTRTARKGELVSLNYGQVTSLALDPIEKKPLNRFCPGSMILSAGSYGCNLKCPFCQNVSISLADGRQEKISVSFETVLDQLPYPCFMRCHHSFLINLSHLRNLQTEEIELDDGTKVPVSRTYRAACREQFVKWQEIWI